jgi:hypothetical protein
MKTFAISVPDRVMNRVRASGRGSVFTPSDFLAVATRSAVDQALSRLVKGGQLRRLGSGLVDQSQKMTVAASAMAEKKTVGQRS